MQKRISFMALLLIAFSANTEAKSLKAILSYKTFYNAENGPYVETYLSVAGNSVKYAKLPSGKYQGKIEVTITFKLNNEIKHFDKYNLLSPEMEDTVNVAFNFIDQHRFQLNNGKYLMDVSIADKNKDAKGFSSSQEINIEYFPNIVCISDIELVDAYKKSETVSILTKNGYEIIPYVNNFYPQDNNSLKFYAEFYNVQKVSGDHPVLVNYFIQSYETKRTLEKFRGFKKQEPKNLNVLLSEFPIAELPSGNYNLVIEIRNKTNDILAFKEVSFQRSNAALTAAGGADASNTFAGQYTNKDSLIDFVRSLRPISSSNEVNFEDNQVKIADIKMMQNFFYDFWAKRNPENPEQAWLEYYKMVKIVNEEFGVHNKKGYETDRGRVFLQYGPPDVRSKEYRELSTYPYEIWHYYALESQSNRKFVFYNRDLVTNDFALLHSDAQGETYEGQWELMLRKRDIQSHDMDKNVNLDGLGNKSNQNFKNPR
ncbi:MAG TPA: GWxTD domain-containing protein [Bacteroidia bacterium]|nr:GWxTD domain-containing protein [Bacteroidia bacterium]